jgi:hypothetical protein
MISSQTQLHISASELISVLGPFQNGKLGKLRDVFIAWGRSPHNMKLNTVKFVFLDWFWMTSHSHDPEEVNQLEVTCMAAGLQVEIQKIFIGEKSATVDPGFFTSSVGLYVPYVQIGWFDSYLWSYRLKSKDKFIW